MKINRRKLMKLLTENVTTSCAKPITRKEFEIGLKKAIDFSTIRETIIPISVLRMSPKIIPTVTD